MESNIKTKAQQIEAAEMITDFLLQEPGEAKEEYAKFKANPEEYLDRLGLTMTIEEAHEEFKEFIEEGKQFWKEQEI